MAIEIAGIDHVVINVSDAERAMRWYQRHLGFEPERYGEWLSGKAPFLSMRVNEVTVIDLLETDRSGENVDHISKNNWLYFHNQMYSLKVIQKLSFP